VDYLSKLIHSPGKGLLYPIDKLDMGGLLFIPDKLHFSGLLIFER